MIGDFESVHAIAALAVGRIGDELTFTYPRVLEVVKLSTTNEIAVLGFELLEPTKAGYATKKLSAYDLPAPTAVDIRNQWPNYVRANNVLAEEFVRANPAGGDDVYVLTTASLSEFQSIQEIRKNGESERG